MVVPQKTIRASCLTWLQRCPQLLARNASASACPRGLLFSIAQFILVVVLQKNYHFMLVSFCELFAPRHQITPGTTQSLCFPISSRNFGDATRTSGTCTWLNHAFKVHLTAPSRESRMTSCGLFGLVNSGSRRGVSRGTAQSIKPTRKES